MQDNLSGSLEWLTQSNQRKVCDVMPDNVDVRGVGFTQQERYFCINALINYVDTMVTSTRYTADEIKVVETLIDDFRGPTWNEETNDI